MGVGFFCLGGLFLSAVIFPLCRFWPGTPGAGVIRAQVVIRHTFRLFLYFLSLLGGVAPVEGEGVQKLSLRGRLVVANHPSLLDVVILLSYMDQADCVVKGALWRNNFLGAVLRSAGYISNDDGPALVDEMAARLKAGRTVLLFPEGTRSPRGGLGPFKRGFARAAMAAGCDILPVVVLCVPSVLSKGWSLGENLDHPIRFSLSVGEVLRPSDFLRPSEGPALAARRIESALRTYYEQRILNEPRNS
jgi:1-acyl-sn-glycerol-3-phosphate acyltransferase